MQRRQTGHWLSPASWTQETEDTAGECYTSHQTSRHEWHLCVSVTHLTWACVIGLLLYLLKLLFLHEGQLFLMLLILLSRERWNKTEILYIWYSHNLTAFLVQWKTRNLNYTKIYLQQSWVLCIRYTEMAFHSWWKSLYFAEILQKHLFRITCLDELHTGSILVFFPCKLVKNKPIKSSYSLNVMRTILVTETTAI